MNAPTGKLIADGNRDTKDQVHLWRSRFIDKCAKCEREIRRLSNIANDDRAYLKAMTEKLISLQTEDGKSPLSKHLMQLLPLIDLRGEIAHAELTRVENTDQNTAVFQNANFAHSHFDKHIVVSAAQRKSTLQLIGSIAGQLANVQS